MKNIIFAILVVGIFISGVIIGLKVGDDLYIPKRMEKVKQTVDSAVSFPKEIIAKIVVTPPLIVAKIGKEMMDGLGSIVSGPQVLEQEIENEQ